MQVGRVQVDTGGWGGRWTRAGRAGGHERVGGQVDMSGWGAGGHEQVGEVDTSGWGGAGGHVRVGQMDTRGWGRWT